MRLILIRHGQTDHNLNRIALGRADVPLNERGRRQARAVAASIVTRPDALYSSPLVRCRETAAAIARGTSATVTLDDRLIEMDVGEMEHLTREELRERYPDFLRLWLSGDASDVADARMPGGETLREVQERGWAAVQAMPEAHPDGTVVAVTHNFVIRTILCRALNLPLGEFRRFEHSVAAFSILDFGKRGPTVKRLNDISHLAAAGLTDDL
jgi:broad specificity phosphatase PhoE